MTEGAAIVRPCPRCAASGKEPIGKWCLRLVPALAAFGLLAAAALVLTVPWLNAPLPGNVKLMLLVGAVCALPFALDLAVGAIPRLGELYRMLKQGTLPACPRCDGRGSEVESGGAWRALRIAGGILLSVYALVLFFRILTAFLSLR